MNETAQTYDHRATYSPQDDKIRLYFSFRIPKDEWDRLKDAGFTWTMKQAENGGCDMVAVWSVDREDMALELAGEIEDEDQPREERAADRAERFEGYQEKRLGEAVSLADRYDAGPKVHGHQNQDRAERARVRHDRIAGKAVNQWEKAEYWQRRTEGVIAHAMYVERADVRHRRIKGLEADLRRLLADVEPSKVIEGVEAVREYRGEEYVAKGHDCVGIFGQGRARYARSYRKADGLGMDARGERWANHLRLRLAYERQMLAAQGGTGADMVEMEAGGFIGRHQVQKVTKDRAGRVSKLYFLAPTAANYDDKGKPYDDDTNPRPLTLHGIDAEKLKPGSYRAPTDAERKAFADAKKEASKAKPKVPPLLNPSKEDAERVQQVWNEAAAARWRKGREGAEGGSYAKQYTEEAAQKILGNTVTSATQEAYSSNARGTYGKCKTVDVAADWTIVDGRRSAKPVVFRLRAADSSIWYGSPRVVYLTDKAAHAIPAMVSQVAAPAAAPALVTTTTASEPEQQALPFMVTA